MNRIKELIKQMNDSGIYLPLIRIEGRASFTGTLTWISFNFALLTQIGKFAGFLGGVDTNASSYLYFGTLAAHLGRRLVAGDKKVDIDGGSK